MRLLMLFPLITMLLLPACVTTHTSIAEMPPHKRVVIEAMGRYQYCVGQGFAENMAATPDRFNELLLQSHAAEAATACEAQLDAYRVLIAERTEGQKFAESAAQRLKEQTQDLWVQYALDLAEEQRLAQTP